MIKVSAWHISDLAYSPVAFPTPMGTTLSFPGVDGQTWKEPFSTPPSSPVDKGPELVLAAAITLAWSPQFLNVSFLTC